MNESEIHDYMGCHIDEWLPFLDIKCGPSVCHELSISDKYIPDYVIFGEHHFSSVPVISIVEVKITADTDSISQILSYNIAIKNQCMDYDISKIRIKKYLFYRFLDSGLDAVAESANINLIRMDIRSKEKIDFSYEKEFEFDDKDLFFNGLLKDFLTKTNYFEESI